jgi:two-component system, LytTR family, sensor kinase
VYQSSKNLTALLSSAGQMKYGRAALHIVFWIVMFEWFLFQSHWMLGDSYTNVSFIIALCRYAMVIFIFYAVSYVILVLQVGIWKPWFMSLLLMLFFLIAYCLMMYFLFGYFCRKYPDIAPSFRNVYKSMSEHGPWTFLRSPLVFYFNFEQLGLAVFPAMAIKIFRLSLQKGVNTLKLEKNNLELELNFLRSQINPHFLFNTLNSLYSLIEEKDALAASIIASLSDMMRYALYESNVPEVEVIRELEFIKGYVEIQNVRHSNRISIEMKFDEDIHTQKVPPLLLVTFLENAVKHGLDKIEKTYIEIKAYREDGNFCFFIRNSKSRKAVKLEEGGIGMRNTRRRLDILYPNRHKLDIKETEKEFTVLLKIW